MGFSIANISYRPTCKICGEKMITITDYNKAVCRFQYLIDDTLFCINCDVEKDRIEKIKEILANPSGPCCRDCKREGFDSCLEVRFEHSQYGDDDCFTSGERQLSVRLDCPIEGDAHPYHAYDRQIF